MKGVIISKLKSFKDKRGEFVELYRDTLGWPVFVEDDISVSKKNVLRGLHGDSATWKLVSCLQGEVFFAIVDPITEEHKEIVLTGENRFVVLVPPNHGIGYCILTKSAMMFYKQSQKWGTSKQFTLPWNGYGIPWPVKKPILSERDSR